MRKALLVLSSLALGASLSVTLPASAQAQTTTPPPGPTTTAAPAPVPAPAPAPTKPGASKGLVRKPLQAAAPTAAQQPGGTRRAAGPTSTDTPPALVGAPGRAIGTDGARMAGIQWSGARPDRIELRSQNADGTWTPWLTATFTDGGDEGHPSPPTTDPVWIGPSKALEIRATRGDDDVSHELTALLVPAEQQARDTAVAPTNETADTQVGSGAGVRSASASLVPLPTPVPVYSRADWGADESIRQGDPYYSDGVKATTVHHTASTNSYTAADVPAQIRGFYLYHVQGNGWSDIGYNALVDRFGRVWEGRYGGLDKPVVGAHVLGFNTNTFGISMIGTYGSIYPSTATREAVAQMIAWKFRISKVGDIYGRTQLTNRASSGNPYQYGQVVTVSPVFGHRDVNYTDCPGNAGYTILPWLRDRVFQLNSLHPEGPLSTSAPEVMAPGSQIVSPNGRYALVMQTDGNLVEYSAERGVLWSSSTAIPSSSLYAQSDGNVVMYSPWHAAWSTNTQSTNAPVRITVADDGNVVVRDGSRNALWDRAMLAGRAASRFQTPLVNLGVGQSVRSVWNNYQMFMQSDGNLVVYSADGRALRASNTAGNPGATFHVQPDGNNVVYADDGRPLWWTGTGPGSYGYLWEDGRVRIFNGGQSVYVW